MHFLSIAYFNIDCSKNLVKVIDEADRVIVEEKQDWYTVFESAVCGVANLSRTKIGLKRFSPLPTIESQCSVTPFTLQKVCFHYFLLCYWFVKINCSL